MPCNLTGRNREKAALFSKRNGFVENALETAFRKQPAWFQIDSTTAPVAKLYDMSCTLTGIDDAIELISEKVMRVGKNTGSDRRKRT